MIRLARTVLPALALLVLGTTAHAQFTAYGTVTLASGAQQLVRFSTSAPSSVTFIGLTGTTLTGIDFRPSNGVLYGYSRGGVFTLDLATGAATRRFDVPSTTGKYAGVDFNPVVDRLSVIDENGTNLRLNVGDGSAFTDAALTYAAGDVNAGNTPFVTGAAYNNNDNDAATGTTLYGVDSQRGTLVMLASPNTGVVSTIGSLGFGAFGGVNGFDIVTVGGVNTAFLSILGGPGGATNSLYTVNLTTGAATFVSTIGAQSGIDGLAIVPGVAPVANVPEPGTLGLLAGGLSLGGLIFRRRRNHD